MVFIETSIFTHRIHPYISDEEYISLQLYLAERPAAGPLFQGPEGFGNFDGCYQAEGNGAEFG